MQAMCFRMKMKCQVLDGPKLLKKVLLWHNAQYKHLQQRHILFDLFVLLTVAHSHADHQCNMDSIVAIEEDVTAEELQVSR